MRGFVLAVRKHFQTEYRAGLFGWLFKYVLLTPAIFAIAAAMIWTAIIWVVGSTGVRWIGASVWV
jgi:hypothetical protein